MRTRKRRVKRNLKRTRVSNERIDIVSRETYWRDEAGSFGAMFLLKA